TSTTVSTLPSFSAHSTRVLDIQHWKTTKGTPVYFVRTPGLPMLDLQVIFNAGASRDDKNFGLAQLTNALLNEGAGNLSADQISEQFDAVGAIFSADAGRDTGIVGLRSLTDPQYLNPALETFTTVLTAPNFNVEALERVRKQILSMIDLES